MNINKQLSACELAKEVRENLLEGQCYDEAVNNVSGTPDSEASKFVDEFFTLCEEGTNPFESYVKAFNCVM